MAVSVFEGEYHDSGWGSAVRAEDRELFAQLSLASQQAGISWRVVWNKKHHYEKAFHDWDLRKVAAMDDEAPWSIFPTMSMGEGPPLVLLERGSILHALGRFLESAKNLQAAEGELELLDLSNDAGGKIAKYIWSDSATKYKTPPVEKLSLNALNMINYLAVGDLNGTFGRVDRGKGGDKELAR